MTVSYYAFLIRLPRNILSLKSHLDLFFSKTSFGYKISKVFEAF